MLQRTSGGALVIQGNVRPSVRPSDGVAPLATLRLPQHPSTRRMPWFVRLAPSSHASGCTACVIATSNNQFNSMALGLDFVAHLE